MARNRHRTTNAIEINSLVKWVAVGALALVLGLTFGSIKIRIHSCGDARRDIEKQLKRLRDENAVLDAQIVKWSARSMLEERLASGFIRMQPIPDDRIVRIQTASNAIEATQVRPVAHEGKRR